MTEDLRLRNAIDRLERIGQLKDKIDGLKREAEDMMVETAEYIRTVSLKADESFLTILYDCELEEFEVDFEIKELKILNE